MMTSMRYTSHILNMGELEMISMFHHAFGTFLTDFPHTAHLHHLFIQI